MYWIGVLLATIGAGLILGALTFVSTLIGVLVNAMIVLMAGPPLARFVASRLRRARKRRLSPGEKKAMRKVADGEAELD